MALPILLLEAPAFSPTALPRHIGLDRCGGSPPFFHGERKSWVPMFVYDAAEQARRPLSAGLHDLVRGLKQVELWWMMGWLDVRQRYSRSVMGPFWITMSLAAFVIGVGVTYSAIFRIPLGEYLPYLTFGMVFWMTLAALLTEGCTVFTANEGVIKQMSASISVQVYRMVWRQVIIFLHNFVIVIVVFILFGVPVTIYTPLFLIGLLALFFNGFCFAVTLGILTARFRDVPPLVGNVTQMLFFITPVLWKADTLRERSFIADYNPLFQMLELFRAPLLGALPSSWAWTSIALFSLVNLAVAVALYGRYRWRVPYWL